jgi:DNA-binding NarL/FixJ family response regulator
MIDDHSVLLDGLTLLLSLEADIVVVGEAETGTRGIAIVIESRPDVVVTDIGLPDIDGLEVTRRLRSLVPETRVLVLTAHDEDSYIFALLEAGASGYLVKNAAGEELVEAIRSVAAGRPWLQPAVAARLIASPGRASRPAAKTGRDALIEPLTNREIEVLRLLAAAASNREIAAALTISTRTVETHLANIYGKLGVRGRTEAMLWAIREGMD